MISIKVVNQLNTYLIEKLQSLCQDQEIECEFNFHSNVQPTTDNQKLRVYITRMIYRENQDTLAVDVGDIGKVRYTSEGVYALSFFIPRNISGSYRKMETIVQQLKNMLRKERFDCVWVRHIRASPFNMENNCYRYDLGFNYYFDEII